MTQWQALGASLLFLIQNRAWQGLFSPSVFTDLRIFRGMTSSRISGEDR